MTPPQTETTNPRPHSAKISISICLGLTLLTLLVFSRVGSFDFVPYDDPDYLLKNEAIQGGFSWASLKWALVANHASNWHPLTWLAHTLDWKMFGDKPRGHHFMNLFLHVCNGVLLFLVFKRMTRLAWPSAFVAALFALHPLHVESVAWLSERKDVLSTFFWLLTMLAYTQFAQAQWLGSKRGRGWYAAALGLFALGLLAKPMVVTLPFVLLLLDFWPLRRFGARPADGTSAGRPFSRLCLEKVPFFALVIISSALTFWAQKTGGSVGSLEANPLISRVANAFVAYGTYMGKMFWPSQLSILYPHPVAWPAGRVILGVALVAGLTAIFLRFGRKHPYLPVGWFWFLGTLVPVIGLVQVGIQSMADRYTYIPMIGLFVIAAWGARDLAARWRVPKAALVGGAFAVLAACSAVTVHQIQFWRNGETLFRRALDVATANPLYQQALETKPIYADIYINLGIALAMEGRLEEASVHLRQAARLNPNLADVHANLGNLCAMQGRWEEATLEFSKAARLNPKDVRILVSLANVLIEQNKLHEAIEHFFSAVKMSPDVADMRFHFGVTLERAGRRDDAALQYRETLRVAPDYAPAQERLKLLARLVVP